MCFRFRKSQAEIYGVALMFVVVILGVVVYSSWSEKFGQSESKQDLLKKQSYKRLVTNSVYSIMATSTGCIYEGEKDSIFNVIEYCLANSYSGSSYDPQITCMEPSSGFVTRPACELSKDLINRTLLNVFNSSEFLNFPYVFRITTPQNSRSVFYNLSFTNFGEFEFRGERVDESNFLRKGFSNMVSNDKDVYETSQGNLEIVLEVYYR